MKALGLLVFIFITAASAVVAGTPIDFDGDGRSDFAVVREAWEGSISHLDWYVSRSSDGTSFGTRFGLGGSDAGSGVGGDQLTPADFDGDGRTDIAIWRSSSLAGMSAYYILKSSDGSVRVVNFGQRFDDASAVGDYDGDGVADPAVYRVTNQPRGKGSGFLYRGSRNNPSGTVTYVAIGGPNMFRYPGDFDGDDKLDFCVRSRSTGVFTLKRSSDLGTENISWGIPQDWAVPGDFDGDGRSDFGVVRDAGSELHWYIAERDGGGTGATPIVWGGLSAVTGQMDAYVWGGDYDGDGKTDITVTRNAQDTVNGQGAKSFLVRRSTDGMGLEFRWGLSGDKVPGAW